MNQMTEKTMTEMPNASTAQDELTLAVNQLVKNMDKQPSLIAAEYSVGEIATAVETKLTNEIESVRSLYRQNMHDTPFKLGDSLTALYRAVETMFGKTSNAQIATFLKLDLSAQRISSLRLTADFSPPESRKSEYPFKLYEQYRKAEQKKKKDEQRLGADLLAAIEANELDSQPAQTKGAATKHTLTIRVVVDTSDPASLKFDPHLLADGAEIGEIANWMLGAAEQAKAALNETFKELA